MEFNQQFLKNMEQLLGGEVESFLKSFQKEPACGLRIQKFKITEEQLEKEFDEMITGKIPWSENGYYYDPQKMDLNQMADSIKNGTLKLGKHPWHIGGAIYIQEPSAQLPAALLDVQPDDYVLDLCAAPGGKSTQIGERLGERGFLLLNEIVKKRAGILLSNLERMGIRNFCVTNNHPKDLAKEFPGFFDKILVDAPCSGEGMFRREKNAAVEYNSDSPEYCARRQSEILESAAEMLRCGGRLVYSTCTFSVAENEGVVSAFLKRHSDFHLIQTPYSNPYFNNDTSSGNAAVPFDCAADFSVCGEMAKTVRLMPHRVQGEGHFAAVFEKDGQDDVKREFDGANSPESELFLQFSQRYLNQKWTGIKVFGGNVYLFPHKLEQLKRCNVIGKGLFAGQNLKGRFVPSHALCMALTPGQVKQVIELDGIQLTQYLRGETLQMASSDGWGTVCYKGVNIGWYKAVDGILKNHFPKGLRI